MFFPAQRIPPYKLWIGSLKDSENVQAARQHGVGLIVNCTRDIPFKVPGVKYIRVPVHDTPSEAKTMAVHLRKAVLAIDHHLEKGDGVLVHCYAGISRSASVVAAYLMHKERLTPRQAIERIQQQKPETFGNGATFHEALTWWHVGRRWHSQTHVKKNVS